MLRTSCEWAIPTNLASSPLTLIDVHIRQGAGSVGVARREDGGVGPVGVGSGGEGGEVWGVGRRTGGDAWQGWD